MRDNEAIILRSMRVPYILKKNNITPKTIIE